MGLCLCKDKSSPQDEQSTCCGCPSPPVCLCCHRWGKRRRGRDDPSSNGSSAAAGGNNGSSRLGGGGDTLRSDRTTSSTASDPNFLLTHTNPTLIDSYVLETLKILRTLVGNDAEAPSSMVKLHKIGITHQYKQLNLSHLIYYYKPLPRKEGDYYHGVLLSSINIILLFGTYS